MCFSFCSYNSHIFETSLSYFHNSLKYSMKPAISERSSLKLSSSILSMISATADTNPDILKSSFLFCLEISKYLNAVFLSNGKILSHSFVFAYALQKVVSSKIKCSDISIFVSLIVLSTYIFASSLTSLIVSSFHFSKSFRIDFTSIIVYIFQPIKVATRAEKNATIIPI